jgi:hypothetical protein
MRTRPQRDPQQTAQSVYNTPYGCGRSYIGDTGRPLAVRRREHCHHLKESLLEKPKLIHKCLQGRS